MQKQTIKRLLTASFTLLPTLLSAQFIINEVDADQTSTDNAEFVELCDGGVGNTPPNGFVLVFSQNYLNPLIGDNQLPEAGRLSLKYPNCSITNHIILVAYGLLHISSICRSLLFA